MCGRYQLGLEYSNQQLDQRFKLTQQSKIDLKSNFNISSSQISPVIIKTNANELRLMRWGLIPFWSKDEKTFFINAKSETLPEKPSFKKLLTNQRCLVPSTGFYEWKKNGKEKTPYFIGLKNHGLFGFAGLFDIWQNNSGQNILSYTIITCVPNKTIAPIHNRMPVILNKNYEEKWLDPNTNNVNELIMLLKPYSDELITAYPISTRVNSPFNNDKSLDQQLPS